MKRERKKGDRVLVRRHDLEEWREGRFSYLKENSHSLVFRVEMPEGLDGFAQCRHIDDFRAGDKVQVSDDGKNWEDAIYLARFKDDGILQHMVETDTDNLVEYKYCRWHPSMPWVKEESLTLEEKVDKMWEQFKTNEQ